MGLGPPACLHKAIRTQIEWADCIIFLGCAFHEPNMIMLRPAEEPSKRPVVFSTGWGFSLDDSTYIQGEIASILRPNSLHFRNNLKCAGLFDNFSRSLAG